MLKNLKNQHLMVRETANQWHIKNPKLDMKNTLSYTY